MTRPPKLNPESVGNLANAVAGADAIDEGMRPPDLASVVVEIPRPTFKFRRSR